MKKLYIIKAGTTFPATKAQFEDFDQWTVNALGSVDIQIGTVDAENGAAYPAIEKCAGIVITGALFVFSFLSNQPEIQFFSISFLGLLVGLLYFNVSPAKLFMGDSGS